MTESQATFSTDHKEACHMSWTNTYTPESQRVFSDFNTLSRYYTITKGGKTYIPPTGSPAYSTQETGQRIIEYYYSNPSAVQSKADVYIVSSQMQENAMFHLGAITTEPNRNLDNQIKKSDDRGLIYSTGSSYTFVS